MLNDNDANEIGDGGTSDAEGEGYEWVVSFENGMKEVELERLCCDANKIESGVEVEDESKKIQQEGIADLVQPGKIYSLQIETLNWM